MHEDEFRKTILELVSLVNAIEELPVAELTKEIQSRIAKLKFTNTAHSRSVQKSYDVLLGLVRVINIAKPKIKRPLRTLFRHMPELKEQIIISPQSTCVVEIKGILEDLTQEAVDTVNSRSTNPIIINSEESDNGDEEESE